MREHYRRATHPETGGEQEKKRKIKVSGHKRATDSAGENTK